MKIKARAAIDNFDPEVERQQRLDLTDQIVCTIDPDDAKDYDDAISLRQLANGNWELGVHIADVSYFVPEGTPLDLEAAERGNSCYFPRLRDSHAAGDFIQRRLLAAGSGSPACAKARSSPTTKMPIPVGTKFANTIINSRKAVALQRSPGDSGSRPDHPASTGGSND